MVSQHTNVIWFPLTRTSHSERATTSETALLVLRCVCRLRRGNTQREAGREISTRQRLGLLAGVEERIDRHRVGATALPRTQPADRPSNKHADNQH